MEITLTELLEAREERVRVQKQMLKDNSCPLICFTMNIAGPIKTSPLIVRAFRYGLGEIQKKLSSFNLFSVRTEFKKTGPVSFMSVNADAQIVKNICVEIEESCLLGRLFDIDVIDKCGTKIERKNERGCIVCGSPGRVCAAGRLHSVFELQNVTLKIMTDHFAREDSRYFADLARKSLIEEVQTTPKPGLVDCSNNGSHTDMTVDTFKKSADALFPYFEECVMIGIKSAKSKAEETFEKLRQAGIKAEKTMFSATNGVNTHKGIIYSMGVILGALGRLWDPAFSVSTAEDILTECSELTKKSVEKDFAKIDNTTAGGRSYLSNGERGIRGEAEKGFPSIKNVSLPTYKKELKTCENKNDAGVITLLHLIANIYDTSIFNRGGEDGVIYAKKYAQKLILKGTPTKDEIIKMDKDFIEKNLSPGGSADLLAITYFLEKTESSNNRSD